jgi:hypothetical protein
VDFAAESLGLVVAEELLEHGCAGGKDNVSEKASMRNVTVGIETYLSGAGQSELKRKPVQDNCQYAWVGAKMIFDLPSRA